MAESFTFKANFKEWDRAFAALSGPVAVSLARRMLVSGGTLLRDVAQSQARQPANAEGVDVRGLLARAIYLAYAPEEETKVSFTYKVSWNRKVAPHGHLIEFGHWMTHAVYKAANGEWYTRKDIPLDTPKWVPARPFLKPAWDSYGKLSIQVMIRRARQSHCRSLRAMH